MSKYTYNKDYFSKIDTSEKAYWLGFLYADGCITRFYKGDELRSMSLEITLQSQDREHLEKFKDSLNANVPIQDRTIAGKYKANRLVINNTKLCNDLIKLGCTPQKSLTLTFPTEEQLKNEYISHFIRGYFDGDGCVSYTEHNVFHKRKNKNYDQYSYVCSFTGNKTFITSIKNVLENNGVKVSPVYKSKSKAVDIYIKGFDNIENFKKYIYKNDSMSLSRKKDKFFFIATNEELLINKRK